MVALGPQAIPNTEPTAIIKAVMIGGKIGLPELFILLTLFGASLDLIIGSAFILKTIWSVAEAR